MPKPITLRCNHHAKTFVKGQEPGEFDDPQEFAKLKAPLGLQGKFTFLYDYPLSKEAHFVHTLTPEMTGEDIMALGRADYERIYAEEDAAVGDPGHIPGMLNRATSQGPYGIWGHDFGDLYFEAIYIQQDAGNLIDFGMGS